MCDGYAFSAAPRAQIVLRHAKSSKARIHWGSDVASATSFANRKGGETEAVVFRTVSAAIVRLHPRGLAANFVMNDQGLRLGSPN
jgi:hypothetical protein